VTQFERSENRYDIQPNDIERGEHEGRFWEHGNEQDSDEHQNKQHSVSWRFDQG